VHFLLRLRTQPLLSLQRFRPSGTFGAHQLLQFWQQPPPTPTSIDLPASSQPLVREDALMLPKGWTRGKLGSIAQVTSGGTPDRGEPRYWGGDIPWVTTGEVRFSEITDTAEKISEAGLQNSAAKVYAPGTILMAMYGQGKTRGQVARLAISAATNQACAAIVLNRGQDPDFYFHVLAWKYRAIRELANSGSQQNLSSGIVKAIEVPVPKIEEQRRIAEVLSYWDRAIATTEQILANARKQRLSLLSKTLHIPAAITDIVDRDRVGSQPPSVRVGIPRLPVTPPGWARLRLSAHLSEVRRPIALEPNNEYVLVTVKRSRGGVQRRGVSLGAEIKTPSQFIVKTGDFLISKRQIVHGACGVVPPELDGAIVSNEYAVLNSDGAIDLNFLRCLSESIYFQQTCFQSSIGVHVEKMLFKTDRWLSCPFNIPPLSEQLRIVEILDAAGAEVALLKRQQLSLKSEKSALMRQLLTGTRRLKLDSAA
jgi:type I restriction enzyme S subunit